MLRRYKKFINLFILACSIFGLFFFGVGIFLIPSIKIKLLGIVMLGLSLTSLILSLLDLLDKSHKINNFLKEISTITGGILLLFISIYLLLSENNNIPIRIVSLFGIIFFGGGLIILIIKKFKIDKKREIRK